MDLRSKFHETEDVFAAQELFHGRGWTDGLPVVPPTETAVRACLEAVALLPDHLIGAEPVRARAITAEKAAINAVMAGCLPMHFPVVVTALTAMLREEFTLHGATASTGGCAIFIIVNGDARRELGMDGTFNALGNSDRATAVIGRAVRLCLINLLDVRPGGIDRSTLGHPGKFSFCVAEDEEGSPWESLATARGVPEGASAVTVMAAGAPRQIMNEWTTDPEEILETFAAEIRANMRQYSIWPGHYAVIVPRSASRALWPPPASRARTCAGGSTSGPVSVAANGPMSARPGWFGTEATPSIEPCPTPSTCSWWRPAARPAVSGRSSRPGSVERAAR